ncbi:hypothetical protein TcasGA2_TC009004 [Tribolium castaneum]|uniref:Uncharacterized protein n=1 Tax=Tribolium castaneum TaxID=7070 RepID=D6WPX9_TRICA|nr:hypothetical protein TcasGA2_TC009004 [Tribolium castaneum]
MKNRERQRGSSAGVYFRPNFTISAKKSRRNFDITYTNAEICYFWLPNDALSRCHLFYQVVIKSFNRMAGTLVDKYLNCWNRVVFHVSSLFVVHDIWKVLAHEEQKSENWKQQLILDGLITARKTTKPETPENALTTQKSSTKVVKFHKHLLCSISTAAAFFRLLYGAKSEKELNACCEALRRLAGCPIRFRFDMCPKLSTSPRSKGNNELCWKDSKD